MSWHICFKYNMFYDIQDKDTIIFFFFWPFLIFLTNTWLYLLSSRLMFVIIVMFLFVYKWTKFSLSLFTPLPTTIQTSLSCLFIYIDKEHEKYLHSLTLITTTTTHWLFHDITVCCIKLFVAMNAMYNYKVAI